MRLILTGGGTGGHIIPNIALLEHFQQDGTSWDILYVGSKKGMEKKMIEELDFKSPHFQLKFTAISCGKLRRYFSWENFLDFFRIIIGTIQSLFKIRRFRPQVIFCKGGYVSFPVAVAGYLSCVPVMLHESDVVPGLANKLLAKFASIICVSFEESKKYFKGKKVIVTGNPLREDIKQGVVAEGYRITGFHINLPVMMVMGGSSGASFINNLIWEILPNLLHNFQIIHISGKGKTQDISHLLKNQANSEELMKRYCGFEYVGKELKHFYAITDLLLSRAGANSLAEIAAIGKPAIIIPLSLRASRGDQIVNAEIFQKYHQSIVLNQEKTTGKILLESIHKLYKIANQASNHANKFSKHKEADAVTVISSLILKYENRY